MDPIHAEGAELDQVRALAEMLANAGPIAIAVDGGTLPLPPAADAIFREAILALSINGSAEVVPHPRTLSLAEAAAILWLSEDELQERIDAGWIPSREGRLAFDDVADARQRRAQDRKHLPRAEDEPHVVHDGVPRD